MQLGVRLEAAERHTNAAGAILKRAFANTANGSLMKACAWVDGRETVRMSTSEKPSYTAASPSPAQAK